MRPSRAVLLAAALLFAWNIWGYDLWAPDEPYFGEGAREMVTDGRWAVPHVNGVVTTDKPPLFFWLIALFSLPLGTVTEWSARLPSVLAGISIVALTLRLGRRLYGDTASLLAGLLLTCNYLVWDKARTAQIDALLCLLILVALSAFESWRSGDSTGGSAGRLFWVAGALAVLAKGPVGILVPLGVVLCTLAVDRSLRRWREFAPLSGPLCFVVIVAAWMALATFGGGGDYSVWGAIREHVLERAVHGMHHAQPPWYYAYSLPVKLLPWSALLPGALWLAWRRFGSGDRFLLCWGLFVVVFFSVPTEKRDLYVLPAFPAFALLAGRLAANAAGVSRRWARWPLLLTGGLLLALGLAAAVAGSRVEEVGAALGVVLGFTLAATGIACAVATVRGSETRGVQLLAVGVGVTYLIAAGFVYPRMNDVKSSRSFAEALREHTAASRTRGDDVLAYGLSNLPEAFAFYSRGVYTTETADPSRLAAHLSAPRRVWAAVDADGLAALPAALRDRLVTVESARLSRRDVRLVHNGAPSGRNQSSFE